MTKGLRNYRIVFKAEGTCDSCHRVRKNHRMLAWQPRQDSPAFLFCSNYCRRNYAKKNFVIESLEEVQI